MRALPLAAGITNAGHYFGPSGAVQTVSDSRRPLFCIFFFFFLVVVLAAVAKPQ